MRASLPILERARLVTISPSASTASLVTEHKYMYLISPAIPFYGPLVPKFAQVELGGTKVSPEIAFTLNGQDVTDQILSPGELDETAFTFVLGGGLRGNIGDRFLVEIAFKFFDIMTEEELSLNKLSFAFGARF